MMSGPARAGALIYAKSLEKLSSFYQQLLGLRCVLADAEHHVLSGGDMQLIIHAIPPHIAATFTIAQPPGPREEQAIKLFFTVDSIEAATAVSRNAGGDVWPKAWSGPGFVAHNGFDCEGNIFHLRQLV